MQKLTEFEKNSIIDCGSEFFKEGNDPYQALANALGITRDAAKSKYYQFLYTNIESVVCRNYLKESFTIRALLDIMKIRGEKWKEALSAATELADQRYQDLVERHKNQNSE